jgi:thiol-disulfide isomerase/thioredoxin
MLRLLDRRYDRSVKTSSLKLALMFTACSSSAALEVDPSAAPRSAPDTMAVPSATLAPVRTYAPSNLPILGDPHGLLSRPPERIENAPRPRSVGALSPDALMAAPNARSQPGESRVVERDPRAVERERASSRKLPIASSQIHELTANRLMSDLRSSPAKLRVLFLYASYCPACRNVMPAVRAAAKRHYDRGVEFTAASVDGNPEAFAAYVPTLEGVFPATLISSDGTMTRELKRLGVPLQGDGYGIPLIAVLDRKQRIVAYGTSGLAARLDQALDSLAQP